MQGSVNKLKHKNDKGGGGWLLFGVGVVGVQFLKSHYIFAKSLCRIGGLGVH
jgi:hypothetical protein